MENTKLFEKVKETIETMKEYELIELWNSYCEAAHYYDDKIEFMVDLPEMFSDDIFNLLNRFYYGHDSNGNESQANPNRNYFKLNGYGNIITTDYPTDFINIDELADFIVEEENSLENNKIEEVLKND